VSYENKRLEDETSGSGAEPWDTGVDGAVDADEDKGKGSSDECQQGQSVVVNRLCGDCQGGSENDEEVIKDIDPDQVNH
jgi:hypothetical protein